MGQLLREVSPDDASELVDFLEIYQAAAEQISGQNPESKVAMSVPNFSKTLTDSAYPRLGGITCR
ncbi:hypothetical protein [Photobacterium sp. 1_MG-2023]|uniref:hypothetical protein n=1 Tax=Photobacterium sp. 1_MG-2023 TaxID=3062646 RepID=UPI0026E25337|nr:hypothetical protein [Photobacterium sp. 1_MG-2023]MDO6706756.1 hypothetical protein [Photobacterium sp. 1_MG-2023]